MACLLKRYSLPTEVDSRKSQGKADPNNRRLEVSDFHIILIFLLI